MSLFSFIRTSRAERRSTPTLERMEPSISRERVLAWIDTAAAILLATCAGWLIYISNEAAAEAVRRYGHNVDSGALTYTVAILYFAPNALLFGIAAITMARSWPLRWFAQWGAATCLIAPAVILALAVLR